MDSDFTGYKPNPQLRAEARADLSGNWGQAVLTYLVYSIVEGAAASLGGIGNLIIGGPIELGLVTYFLNIKRREGAQIEDLFSGFRLFEKSLVLYLIRTVYIVLWTILLIIPGIVAALRYSMAMYLLHDNPSMTGMEAMKASSQLMEGNKLRLFELYLSFIGWGILCCFTFGVGFLWLLPYIKATEASFYETLLSGERV